MARIFRTMNDFQRRYFPKSIYERLKARLKNNNLNELESISDESFVRENEKDYLEGIFNFKRGSVYGLINGDTEKIINELKSFYREEGHKILEKAEDSFEFLKRGTKNKKYRVSLISNNSNLTLIVRSIYYNYFSTSAILISQRDKG